MTQMSASEKNNPSPQNPSAIQSDNCGKYNVSKNPLVTFVNEVSSKNFYII